MASNEQAIGIGQVNQGILQVSQIAQANSATSQESASASEEIPQIRMEMVRITGKILPGRHRLQSLRLY